MLLTPDTCTLSLLILYSFPTVRAVFEIRIQNFTAIFAVFGICLLPSGFRTKIINAAFAAIAHYKRFAFFDSEKWNKKEAEVMIRALVIGPMQSANRTSAGILIKNFNFGRNTGDKDHGSTITWSVGVLEYWNYKK